MFSLSIGSWGHAYPQGRRRLQQRCWFPNGFLLSLLGPARGGGGRLFGFVIQRSMDLIQCPVNGHCITNRCQCLDVRRQAAVESTGGAWRGVWRCQVVEFGCFRSLMKPIAQLSEKILRWLAFGSRKADAQHQECVLTRGATQECG